jgi:hypothetical protein
VAQLHLAFASPIAPIKRQDKRKLSDRVGELDRLPVMIRQLEIGKTLTDLQIHDHTSLAEVEL